MPHYITDEQSAELTPVLEAVTAEIYRIQAEAAASILAIKAEQNRIEQEFINRWVQEAVTEVGHSPGLQRLNIQELFRKDVQELLKGIQRKLCPPATAPVLSEAQLERARTLMQTTRALSR